MAGTIDGEGLEGVAAVVHLAGAGIGAKRWSAERKRLILESRTRGTSLLAGALAGLDRKPRVLVSASGIDYYGDTGDQPVTEDASQGAGFLAQVCGAWEAATAAATEAGIRVVNMRSGMVLARHGGALPRLVLPFRLGLGGRIASGRQYTPWITLDDEVGAIVHAIDTEQLAGPVNFVAPNQVTNNEFTKTLGTVLRRPTVLPTPLLPLKMRYGAELVQHLLVDGQRAIPAKLESTAFRYEHPVLEGALRSVLGRPAR